jgi:hypothetical protein
MTKQELVLLALDDLRAIVDRVGREGFHADEKERTKLNGRMADLRSRVPAWLRGETPELVVTDQALRHLLNALMCNDPPPDWSADNVLRSIADKASSQRGYENWEVAYHEWKKDAEP